MVKAVIEGRIIAVQPRIRLLRSFDQRQHNYPGYALLVESPGEQGNWIGVGPAAHAKFRFSAGGIFAAEVEPVANPETEAVNFYKASKVRYEPGETPSGSPLSVSVPPWLGVPPELPAYRARGHRRLDPGAYEIFCHRCIWGCRMAVEMTLDQWNPKEKAYRKETFCYGPKSCPKYQSGPVREVPGRNGTTWIEEDWVDDEATSHRGPDE